METAQSRVSRRNMLALAGGVAGAMVLAACGAVPAAPGADAPTAAAPAGTAAPAAPAAKSAEVVTISWAVESYEAGMAAQAEGIRVFQEQNPTIKVEARQFTSTKDTNVAWIAGSGPDAAASFSTDLVDAGRSGLAEPLDPYIKRDSAAVPLDDFVKFLLAMVQTPEIGTYGLLLTANVRLLYYNKVAFERAGLDEPTDAWDWNTYQESLLAVTDVDQQQYGGLLWDARAAAMWINSNGGEVVDPADDSKPAFTSDQALEALQWSHDRVWKDRSVITNTSEEWKGMGLKSTLEAVPLGKIVMYQMFGTQAAVGVAGAVPNAADAWDVAPIPSGPVSRNALTGTDATLMWSGSKAKDQVWEFLKFLQTPDWYHIWTTVAGAQPPRVSLQEQYAETLKTTFPQLSDKNIAAFTDGVTKGYARAEPLFRKHAEAWPAFVDAWNASVRDNTRSVQDAFREAADKVTAVHAG